MSDSDRYVLLDIRGLILHGYHQGKDPDAGVDENGETVNGSGWGLERMLLEYQIFEQVPPRRMIAVWDGGNEYRKALFPGYKKKRLEKSQQKSPEKKRAVEDIMSTVRRMLDSIGVTQVTVPGVEADDVVAWLASKLPGSTVYTVDQDLFQLAALYPGTQVIYHNQVMSDYRGVPASLVALYKSIVGDTSDEYPGVPGLGEKKFSAMLEAYGVDGMEELDRIVREQDWMAFQEVCQEANDPILDALWVQREHWYLQHLLASVNPGLCEGVRNGKIVRPEWRRRVPMKATLLELEKETGVPELASRFSRWLPDYTLVDSTPEGNQRLRHFLSNLKLSPFIPFDYETYDTLRHPAFQEATNGREYVDVISQEVTGVSFAYGDNWQYVIYVPCNHIDTLNFKPANIAWLVKEVSDNATVVAHNAPFEASVTLNQFGLSIEDIKDTRLMASYVDENQSLHLKDLSKEFLRFHQTTYAETLAKFGASDMTQISGKNVLTYGCDDSIVTAHLADLFYLVMKTEATWPFFCENESKLIHEQVRGFLAGCKVDAEHIRKLDEKDTATYEKSVARIRELLSQHCTKENEEGATRLYLEMEPFERARLEDQGKTEDQIEEYLTNLWDRIVLGSKYVPYQEVPKETPEFKPTPKQLAQVAMKLALPAIDKTTKKAITEWVGEADAQLDLAIRGGGQVRGEQVEFVRRLADAAHLLSKREGKEYDELVEVCREVLGLGQVEQVVKVGDELNFGSPQQMQWLLYGKLGLPIRRRSAVKDRKSTRYRLGFKGSPSTDDEAIAAALAEDVTKDDWRYEVLELYLEVKRILTAKSLFYKPLPLFIHPSDGMVHAGLQNCGTVTRRPSCSSPNFLQITKSDKDGLRGGFRPSGPDRVIVAADFNGQELRIIASESKDPALLDAYIGPVKKDVHSVTASAISPTFFRQAHFRQEYGLPEDYAGIHEVSYEDFIDALNDDQLGKAMGKVRKSAKACIAKGSLVLTKRGLVPIELVLLSDLLWDGVEWVSHEGVIYKGFKEVITYGGVTATPDHKVFTQDGRILPIGDCASEPERPSLAVGEIEGRPVRYQGSSGTGAMEEGQELGHILPSSEGEVLCLQEGVRFECQQRAERPQQGLLLSDHLEETYRPAPQGSGSEILGHEPALHQPSEPLLQELWGERSREQVQEPGPVCHLGYGESTPRELPWGGDRQEGQQRALRARQSSAGNEAAEPDQQAYEQVGGVQGPDGGTKPPMAFNEAGSPRIPVVTEDGIQASEQRDASGTDPEAQEDNVRRAHVYDIVNAGPRHRFTVSGKVVANCNFLISYLGGYTTLAQRLLVPDEIAKMLMEMTFARYSRLRPWQQEVIEFARSHGYTQTAYGNRRHLTSDLFSPDDGVRTRMERQGVNYTIQGCAADILKEVMARAHDTGLFTETDSYLIAPVYDELVADVPRAAAWEFCSRLKEVMEVTPPGHAVPMLAEFSVSAHSWGGVVEIGADITEEKVLSALEDSMKEAA